MARVIILLLLGVVLVGGGAYAWLAMQPAPPAPVAEARAAPPPPPVMAPMLVVGRSVQAGSLLRPEDFAAREIVAATLPEGARLDTPLARGELRGAMVRRSLAPGDPVLPADVLRPGDHGFLAAVLAAGRRAVTVGVDAVSGTAGLIWPGDRVDLILTQALENEAIPATHRVFGETVLTDVRVIAVDRSLVHGAEAALVDNPNATSRTVTLEVTPRQAERVAVAGRLGRLALSVRSAVRETGDGPAEEVSPVTWGADVSPALRDAAPVRGSNAVRVHQGTTRVEEVRF